MTKTRSQPRLTLGAFVYMSPLRVSLTLDTRAKSG